MRTKKDFGDRSVNYYYNRGNIILETDKNNMATARNIRGLRLIYRENNPGQVDSQFLYYLHNAHGDVTQLLNERGQLIKDYRYDTFGQEEMPEAQVFGGKQTGELWRQEVEKIDNPFRYCGEYLDDETGNYYLRARYYDPAVQRFVNEDSYGVKFGAGWKQHLYNYVGNNPINRIDPTGHFFIPIPSVSSILSPVINFVTNIATNIATSIGLSNSNVSSGSSSSSSTNGVSSGKYTGSNQVPNSKLVTIASINKDLSPNTKVEGIVDKIKKLIAENEKLKKNYSDNKKIQLGLTVNISMNFAAIAEARTEIGVKSGLLLFWSHRGDQTKVKEIKDDLANIKQDIERRWDQIERDYGRISTLKESQRDIINQWQNNFQEIQRLQKDYKNLTGREYKLPWYAIVWPD